MTRFIRNSRGQVAIFIALLFQVLFLFFAMIVNVGLLIHHKINLQNSVDLAAYYGAMKQAEVLNSIAHVNYQIRQSWKLLVWRHRVLGSAGAESPPQNAFPFEKLTRNTGPVTDVLAGSGNSTFQNLYRQPRFCIAYAPHEVFGSAAGGDAENACKRSYEETARTTLPDPGVLRIPGFFKFGQIVGGAIANAVSQATNRCATVGSLNYVMGGKFIAGYINDSMERAYLIEHLANGLSAQQDDFFEITGDSAKVGLEKTLRNNLTDANRSSLEFKMLNGFGLGACRGSGGTTGTFSKAPPWLVPIDVFPVWRYSDCSATTAGATTINLKPKQLDRYNAPELVNGAPQTLKDLVQEVIDNLEPVPTFIGFEKDPWCMGYVGVKATTKPKIPFMPLSEIELSAEAYAKPFGGRIGPWYYKNWQPTEAGAARIAATANGINRDSRTEPNGAIRVTDLGGLTASIVGDEAWAPNVARFVGDGTNYAVHPGGFAAEEVLAYFHRALRMYGFGGQESFYANISPSGGTYPFPVVNETNVSLSYYDHIGAPLNSALGQGLDQLSWGKNLNGAPRLRLMEIAAVAPNLFDLAYYSIEPDFYNHYYKKIQAAIANGNGNYSGWNPSRKVLGDLGSRFDIAPAAQAMNIFDQIKIQNDVGGQKALNSVESMPYVVKNSGHLLNSWAVDSLRDYRTNMFKFGKCLSPDSAAPGQFEQPLSPSTPGNCVDGGRVGYSVKMVGRSYLKAGDLSLGGNGASPGPLRNPPPDDW